MICIEESFMNHPNITPFVEQIYCWIIYSDLLRFMEHSCFLIVFTIDGETIVSFVFGMENFINFVYLTVPSAKS